MTNKKPLKIQIPAQGWRQFLTSRKEMLDAYDSARDKARAHEVETYHGKVAEAEFRNWLKNFLPKRYGVTPGYIISQGLSSNQKAPHYDVIIYDSLESPVLWVEDNPDRSETGKSLAIPAEYVSGVIEVKSSYSPKSVKQAIEHLHDLELLLGGVDAVDDRYKFYLPESFFCGLVFFELRESEKTKEKALVNLVDGSNLRGFIGGIILRGDNHSRPFTGRLQLVRHESPKESLISKSDISLLDGAVISKTIEKDNEYLGGMLTWAEPHFSQFAFDLISIMRGDYELGKISSFHGFGASEWESIWKEKKG